MSAIKVDRVAIGYSNTLIIDDLSVSIPEKKITTIIGPNGCGKSTLLKAISSISIGNRSAINYRWCCGIPSLIKQRQIKLT